MRLEKFLRSAATLFFLLIASSWGHADESWLGKRAFFKEHAVARDGSRLDHISLGLPVQDVDDEGVLVAGVWVLNTTGGPPKKIKASRTHGLKIIRGIIQNHRHASLGTGFFHFLQQPFEAEGFQPGIIVEEKEVFGSVCDCCFSSGVTAAGVAPVGVQPHYVYPGRERFYRWPRILD